MPTLNDYLGGLIASLTDARMMADARSVQVAELYAQHDLLRHFPIPRMRIGDITLDVPLAIEGLAEKIGFQLDPIGNAEFKRIAARELARYIDYTELPAVPAQKLQLALGPRIDALIEGIRSTGDVQKPMLAFAEGATADLFAIGIEAKLHDGKFPDGYAQDEVAKRCFELGLGLVTGVVEKPVLEQLTVIADAARLREQRPEDMLRIRVTVGEDGMEWQTIERDDGTLERRLIPE